MVEKGLSLQLEALREFVDERVHGSFHIKPTNGGINNVVHYCDCANDGYRVVVRIYNNGQNHEQVQYEHVVLRELAREQPRLTFSIPKALPALRTPHHTHVLLSSGDDACAFEFIPGAGLALHQAFNFGRAAGELVAALGRITPVVQAVHTCIAPPYHELYRVHHAVSRDVFLRIMGCESEEGNGEGEGEGEGGGGGGGETPVELTAIRSSCDYILQQVLAVEASISKIQSLNPPTQIIHGDLVYNNVLYDEISGNITGLIDFEFVAVDWRAMELAISLSKYANEVARWELFDDFIRGYAVSGSLCEEEIKFVPALLGLRLASNIVYFVGRAIAGEDTWDTLANKIVIYETRLRWVRENEQGIIQLIHNHFATKTASA